LSNIAVQGNPITTNHICTFNTKCFEGDPTVTVNDVPVHYQGGRTEDYPHSYDVDGNGNCTIMHSPTLPSASPTVMVFPNSTPVGIARVGDSYTECGTIIQSANITVFAD